MSPFAIPNAAFTDANEALYLFCAATAAAYALRIACDGLAGKADKRFKPCIICTVTN